jgi:hypothetical protein
MGDPNEIERKPRWIPTADNINKLPPGLFEYVNGLETLCDPGDMIAENTLLRDEVRMLAKRLQEKGE